MRMTDRNDIERLFKANYGGMQRTAVALVHDDDLARDIVHEVFATLIEGRLYKSRSERAITGYLLNAVRNRCLNHIRDCNTRQRILKRYFLENEEYESEEWPDEETLATIQESIGNEVSPQARRVIYLRFERGEKFSKIAETMGISETAVYRHLSHALNIIRTKLNEHGKS